MILVPLDINKNICISITIYAIYVYQTFNIWVWNICSAKKEVILKRMKACDTEHRNQTQSASKGHIYNSLSSCTSSSRVLIIIIIMIIAIIIMFLLDYDLIQVFKINITSNKSRYLAPTKFTSPLCYSCPKFQTSIKF